MLIMPKALLMDIAKDNRPFKDNIKKISTALNKDDFGAYNDFARATKNVEDEQ